MSLSFGWKRAVALMCAGVMGAALAGCSEQELPLDAQHGIADQSMLYGMCYLLEERTADSLDIGAEVQLMKNLGVKTVRQWMHFTHFMSDPSTFHEEWETTKNMRALLAACTEAGIVNIGMNHHNFCTTDGKASTTAKPFARDVSEGSKYVQWLNDYYTSWYTLVSAFPEVMYWEIDNEVNNPDFMTDSAVKGQSSYNVRQMAEIATDMFYYASRAIHDANPEAQTIMGGLTEPNGLGTGNTAAFLQYLYDNIASGEYGYFYGQEDAGTASTDPDDYFQIACWHPYMSNFNRQNFIDINNEYYEIILKNEGKHKKVFLSEIGFSDFGRGQTVAAQSVTNLYHAVSTRMPYVETVNLFKMYDVARDSWGGAGEQDNGYARYGLFYDPDPSRVYYRLDEENPTQTTDELCVPAAPKLTAYAFQTAAGGSGSLTLLSEQQ